MRAAGPGAYTLPATLSAPEKRPANKQFFASSGERFADVSKQSRQISAIAPRLRIKILHPGFFLISILRSPTPSQPVACHSACHSLYILCVCMCVRACMCMCAASASIHAHYHRSRQLHAHHLRLRQDAARQHEAPEDDGALGLG